MISIIRLQSQERKERICDLQFSILTGNEETLNNYLTGVVEKMPGVLRTTVNLIERTKPLVSYERWREYSLKHGIVPSWDEKIMIGQFQK